MVLNASNLNIKRTDYRTKSNNKKVNYTLRDMTDYNSQFNENLVFGVHYHFFTLGKNIENKQKLPL